MNIHEFMTRMESWIHCLENGQWVSDDFILRKKTFLHAWIKCKNLDRQEILKKYKQDQIHPYNNETNQLMQNYLNVYTFRIINSIVEESELKLVLISRQISILSWNKIKRSSFFWITFKSSWILVVWNIYTLCLKFYCQKNTEIKT